MKSRLPLYIGFLSLALFLGACNKDDDSKDTKEGSITFQTKMALSDGGDSYQIGDTLSMNTGYDFNVKKFKLYLSNVTLVGADGEQEIKDILLADVGDLNTGAFNATVPEGNYSQLRLGFGLDAEQNNQNPEDFEREHPLSSWNQMYWTMLKYRFAILEGRSDHTGALNGDTTDILNAYHPGLDSLYRVVNYPINLEVSADGTYQVNLVVNIDELFSAGEGIDMREEPQTHSELGSSSFPGDFHIAKKFMDNLAETARLEIP